MESYRCVKCKDTGWVIEREKDKQDTMRRCECIEQEILRNYWKQAGINPETSKQTFSNFEAWNEIANNAKGVAIAYYKDFQEIRNNKRNSIMFCGQVGSGKTHLSIALALNLIKKSIKVVYLPYRDIMTSLKQNMIDEAFYNRYMNKFKSADVLLIDDLFKGKLTETDINIMFEIINHRYLNNKPLIISSEFTIDRLLNFDEAVGSRIYEMCKDYIVQIEGQENNYRMRS